MEELSPIIGLDGPWVGHSFPLMQLTINGEAKEFADGLTISELLAALGLEGPVAVEKNREIVPRAQHAAEKLKDGDVLELVHFVGGG